MKTEKLQKYVYFQYPNKEKEFVKLAKKRNVSRSYLIRTLQDNADQTLTNLDYQDKGFNR